MTLFTYVVRWDHGFAPNPFHRFCTLATCKPAIRKKAKLGDWILGTGTAERKCQGSVVFLMHVDEIKTFDDYWTETRFRCKRPVMNGSLKQRFGDNIYHHKPDGSWDQADSRHSWNGFPNEQNLKRDTEKSQNVLIGHDFVYWGGNNAPVIPRNLRHFVISRPGFDDRYSQEQINQLVTWVNSFNQQGQVGDPLEWQYEKWWR